MILAQVTSEPFEFIIDHSEKQQQGVHLFYKGVKYPRRVYHDPLNDPNHFLRVLNALATVKKVFLTLTYLNGIVIPRTLNIKRYERFLENLFLICEWNLREFFLKDDEYSIPVWEIGQFFKNFLINLGLKKSLCEDYAKAIMMITEYDNAYRYRAQDILGEANKNALVNNPIKEIKRLFQIYAQREGMLGVKEKIGKFLQFRYLLYLPKIRRAFAKAALDAKFGLMALDINDRYHTSFWRGYDYGGLNFDARYQFFLDTHKGQFPPFRKRDAPPLDFLTKE